MFEMKPINILDKAILIGGHPSLISSKRYKRYEGRPGEIIERLPEHDREILKNLKSEDLSEEKLPRCTAWLGYEGYWEDRWKYADQKLILDFDKKIIKKNIL